MSAGHLYLAVFNERARKFAGSKHNGKTKSNLSVGHISADSPTATTTTTDPIVCLSRMPPAAAVAPDYYLSHSNADSRQSSGGSELG